MRTYVFDSLIRGVISKLGVEKNPNPVNRGIKLVD